MVLDRFLGGGRGCAVGGLVALAEAPVPEPAVVSVFLFLWAAPSSRRAPPTSPAVSCLPPAVVCVFLVLWAAPSSRRAPPTPPAVSCTLLNAPARAGAQMRACAHPAHHLARGGCAHRVRRA